MDGGGKSGHSGRAEVEARGRSSVLWLVTMWHVCCVRALRVNVSLAPPVADDGASRYVTRKRELGLVDLDLGSIWIEHVS